MESFADPIVIEDSDNRITSDTFEALVFGDDRIVHKLEVIELETLDSPTNSSPVKTFKMRYEANNGESLGESLRSFEIKRDVTLDVVAFRRGESNHEVELALHRGPHPTIAAEAFLNGRTPEGALSWEILKGKGSISDEATQLNANVGQVLVQHGLTSTGVAVIPLGGGYSPSLGTSTEYCFPVAIAVDNKTHGVMSFGEGITASREISFFTLQDVIHRFLSGEIKDVRAPLLAFRLADTLGVAIQLRGELLTSMSVQKEEDSLLPLAHLEELRVLTQGNVAEGPNIAIVTGEEVLSNSLQQFVIPYRALVKNVGGVGVSDEPYESLVVGRKNNDSVDVISAVFIETKSGEQKLTLVVKQGVREAQVLSSGGGGSPFVLEGIAESLEGEQTIDEIIMRGLQGVREEAGVEPCGQPTYLGFSFPSLETLTERAHIVFTECDTRVTSGVPRDLNEVRSVVLADIDDLIALGNEGAVRDPRLLLYAYLLRAFKPR